MKNLYFILCLLFCVGCYTNDDLKNDHFAWSIFKDAVNKDVQGEVNHEPRNGGATWSEHWIHWCESLYHNPNLGDPFIQYIVDQRRTVGLPDIPEINKRMFRSKWTIFIENVNKNLVREKSNEKAPPGFQKWSEYWKMVEIRAKLDPELGEKGILYIAEQRKTFGLNLTQ